MENANQKNSHENNHRNTSAEKVLAKIRAQQLTMRPRFYFTLKSLALGSVAIITLLLSVSIGCFILFTVRTSYETSLLGFGPSGIFIFLQLFPWSLLVADIACIILLEWMLRKFRFGYKSPLLYLLFVILVVILSVSGVLDNDHISDFVLRGAHDHSVPVIGDFYDQGRRPPPPGSGVCPCIITAIDGNTLTMQENVPDGTTRDVTVILPNNQASSTLKVGDRLFIVGTFDGTVLHAFGIQPLDHDGDAPASQMPLQNQ